MGVQGVLCAVKDPEGRHVVTKAIPMAAWRQAVPNFTSPDHAVSNRTALIMSWLVTALPSLLGLGAVTRSNKYVARRLAEVMPFRAITEELPIFADPSKIPGRDQNMDDWGKGNNTRGGADMERTASEEAWHKRMLMVMRMVEKHKAKQRFNQRTDQEGRKHDERQAALAAKASVGVPPSDVLQQCTCCGCTKGPGHGSICSHLYGRCKPCMLLKRRQLRHPEDFKPTRTRGPLPSQLPVAGAVVEQAEPEAEAEAVLEAKAGSSEAEVDGTSSEGDYEWVTDSDDDDPVYMCDACGEHIGPDENRFHCSQCDDIDLCHSCQVSKKMVKGALGVGVIRVCQGRRDLCQRGKEGLESEATPVFSHPTNQLRDPLLLFQLLAAPLLCYPLNPKPISTDRVLAWQSC
ncbi:unnamed protein product [Chrysoparadoxa australica]